MSTTAGIIQSTLGHVPDCSLHGDRYGPARRSDFLIPGETTKAYSTKPLPKAENFGVELSYGFAQRSLHVRTLSNANEED